MKVARSSSILKRSASELVSADEVRTAAVLGVALAEHVQLLERVVEEKDAENKEYSTLVAELRNALDAKIQEATFYEEKVAYLGTQCKLLEIQNKNIRLMIEASSQKSEESVNNDEDGEHLHFCTQAIQPLTPAAEGLQNAFESAFRSSRESIAAAFLPQTPKLDEELVNVNKRLSNQLAECESIILRQHDQISILTTKINTLSQSSTFDQRFNERDQGTHQKQKAAMLLKPSISSCVTTSGSFACILAETKPRVLCCFGAALRCELIHIAVERRTNTKIFVCTLEAAQKRSWEISSKPDHFDGLAANGSVLRLVDRVPELQRAKKNGTLQHFSVRPVGSAATFSGKNCDWSSAVMILDAVLLLNGEN